MHSSDDKTLFVLFKAVAEKNNGDKITENLYKLQNTVV